MNCDLIVVGKTDSKEVEALVNLYAARINNYVRFSTIVIPDLKNRRTLSEQQQRELEGVQIMRRVSAGDCVVLLDERGSQMRSVEFAQWIERRINTATRRLIFVIGGPYGFCDEVYARADHRLSLSAMTFSHQIVRAIFAEQLYRAFSIIRGEPYHHE